MSAFGDVDFAGLARAVAIVAVLFVPQFSAAQTTATATAILGETSGIVTMVADARAKLQTLSQSDATSDSATLAQRDLWSQTLDLLGQCDQWTSTAVENERAISTADSNTSVARREIDMPSPVFSGDQLATASVAEIQGILDSEQAGMDGLRKREGQLKGEVQRRATRRSEIPTRMSELRQKRLDLDAQPEPAAVELPDIVEARRKLLIAQKILVNSEMHALETEQRKYDRTDDLVAAQQELISKKSQSSQQKIDTLTKLLSRRKKEEVTAAAAKVKLLAETVDKTNPLIRQLVDENTTLSVERGGQGSVADREDAAQQRLDSVKAALAKVSDSDRSLRQKVDAVGLNDSIGIVLRKARQELAGIRDQYEHSKSPQGEVSEVQLRILEIEDQLSALQNVEGAARDMIASSPGAAAAMPADELTSQVRMLLDARKTMLKGLLTEYNQYSNLLFTLTVDERQLSVQSDQLASFIDERVLWIPSAKSFHASDIVLASRNGVDLFSIENIRKAVDSLRRDFVGNPALYGAFFLLIAGLALSRNVRRTKLKLFIDEAEKKRAISVLPLFYAYGTLALVALPIPLTLGWLGWRLAVNSDGHDIIAKYGYGFLQVAVALLLIRIVRVITRTDGIAVRLFGWPHNSAKRIRTLAHWLVWVFLPLLFVINVAYDLTDESRDELARVALMLSIIVGGIVIYTLFHPTRGVLRVIFARNLKGWLYKYRSLWFVGMLLAPISLFILTWVGYVYTVERLGIRLSISAWFGVGLLLLNETLIFWILVNRRRLAMEEARKRRQLAKEQSVDGKPSDSADLPDVPREPQIDIAAVGKQAGKLLHVVLICIVLTGLWAIWKDVLPALGFLNRVTLWSHVSQVTTATAGADGNVLTQVSDKILPVTLADLLLALLVFLVTAAAARNLPGLLEITLFQRLGLKGGERYAINTLIRYVLITAGAVAIFYLVGLEWRNIQWMVAGISVGLGFGLQEIFANFISGLILLFERPIRVGDVVTVGEASGRVSQIRIRATIIVNGDHKEFIIPNKMLVTGQVLNWTLNDSIVKVTIKAELAHDSDYEKTRRILLGLAKSNPNVLAEPAPAAAIEKFSEAGVEFVLMVHLATLDSAMETRHALIAGMEKEFAANGIAFASPGRNVSVKFERTEDEV